MLKKWTLLESKLPAGEMQAGRNSRNPVSYGCREGARLRLKAIKGLLLCKAAVKKLYGKCFLYNKTPLLKCFADDNYWSSSENNSNNAWKQNFNDGN